MSSSTPNSFTSGSPPINNGILPSGMNIGPGGGAAVVTYNTAGTPSGMNLATVNPNIPSIGTTTTKASFNVKTSKQILPFENEALRLKQKCKDLTQRIHDVEQNNEMRAVLVSRLRQTIKRLRFEYTILLESLEKKSNDASIPNLSHLKVDNLDPDDMEGLSLSDITHLLSTTPLDIAKANEKLLPKVDLNPEKPGTHNGSSPSNHNGSTTGKKVRGQSKKPKKAKDPNLPKRPTNAYLIFCELEKERIKREQEARQPGVNVDMSKAMADDWKLLKVDSRKPYYDLYEKDRLRYQTELKEYNLKKQAGFFDADNSSAATNGNGTSSKANNTPVTTAAPTPVDTTSAAVEPPINDLEQEPKSEVGIEEGDVTNLTIASSPAPTDTPELEAEDDSVLPPILTEEPSTSAATTNDHPAPEVEDGDDSHVAKKVKIEEEQLV